MRKPSLAKIVADLHRRKIVYLSFNDWNTYQLEELTLQRLYVYIDWVNSIIAVTKEPM